MDESATPPEAQPAAQAETPVETRAEAQVEAPVEVPAVSQADDLAQIESLEADLAAIEQELSALDSPTPDPSAGRVVGAG